eukprot:GSChrysophyteH1.ASY1.ANO1.1797.1 assembled CDS
MANFDGGKESDLPLPGWVPTGCEILADGEYDAIILGTGLTNMILSGLLATAGKRVLIVDRNNYYGAESASLDLQKLFEKFRGAEAGSSVPKEFGRHQDWAVDLIPKFIMADGNLTKILLHSKVTRYLEFKSIDASYVYTADDGGWITKSDKIEKVPTTPAEALSSGLMNMLQKRKFRNFLIFMDAYNEKDPATFLKNKTLDQYSMIEVFTYFDLNENTMSFIGHAMMLFPDDDYLHKPANVGGAALKLYMSSMQRYPPYTSPYIYPLYGLGGLPEGFSRICAIHGGTFMLNTPVDEVLEKDGVAWGIKSGTKIAKAKQIIGEAGYFKREQTRVEGQVARSICILDHPIPNTNNADTTVETSNPISELAPGLKLLGDIKERFDSISDIYAPVSDGRKDACYISRSYDAASHFESAATDVLNMYECLTGEKLDMSIDPDLQDDC